MKCFLRGFMGALLVLIGAFFLNSQYSSYRARAEIDGWLVQIETLQSLIAHNAMKQKSFINAGRDVDTSVYKQMNIDMIDVTESSSIVIRGGREGQVVVLTPSLSDGIITWRCIGGPEHAVPNKCAATREKN